MVWSEIRIDIEHRIGSFWDYLSHNYFQILENGKNINEREKHCETLNPIIDKKKTGDSKVLESIRPLVNYIPPSVYAQLNIDYKSNINYRLYRL